MDCETCQGPTATDCLTCRSSEMVYTLLNHSCICPPQYFNSNGNCIRIYIYIYIYIYIGCHDCCRSCIGPNEEDCMECNPENGCYAMDNDVAKCIFNCIDSSIALYIEEASNRCLPCHPNCSRCSGPLDSECFQCVAPVVLTTPNECKFTTCEHIPNTVLVEEECRICDERCNGCIDIPNQCTACLPPYLLLVGTNLCLQTCPPQYYDNQMNLCLSIYKLYIYIYIIYILYRMRR